MSALDVSVKKHHPSCGIFQSPIWDCNCGADKAKVELEALRTRITEQEARIAELERQEFNIAEAVSLLREVDDRVTGMQFGYEDKNGEPLSRRISLFLSEQPLKIHPLIPINSALQKAEPK